MPVSPELLAFNTLFNSPRYDFKEIAADQNFFTDAAERIWTRYAGRDIFPLWVDPAVPSKDVPTAPL